MANNVASESPYSFSAITSLFDPLVLIFQNKKDVSSPLEVLVYNFRLRVASINPFDDGSKEKVYNDDYWDNLFG